MASFLFFLVVPAWALLSPGPLGPPRRTVACSGKRQKETYIDREERLAKEAYGKKLEKMEQKVRGGSSQAERRRRKKKSEPKKEEVPEAIKASPLPSVVSLPKRRLGFDALSPATFLGGYDNFAALPQRPLPEVAFLGRSNVGKSSLLNALLAKRKGVAVTSQRPGRTRRINLFQVEDTKGTSCYLADLPGYGFAKLSQEEQDVIGRFVMDYLERRPQLRCLVFLVDARREPSEEDAFILAQFKKNTHLKVQVVATKIDKIDNGDDLLLKLNKLNLAYELPPDQPLYFSAVTRQGRSDLWAAINDAISSQPQQAAPPLLQEEEEEDYVDDDDDYHQDGNHLDQLLPPDDEDDLIVLR